LERREGGEGGSSKKRSKKFEKKIEKKSKKSSKKSSKNIYEKLQIVGGRVENCHSNS
jgi:hypothetical protein